MENVGSWFLSLHQLLLGKIREQIRHCGFLMATRKSL
jgi:hypothetical protein